MPARCLLTAGTVAVMLAVPGCGDDKAPSATDMSEGEDRGVTVTDARTETGMGSAGASPVR